MGFFGWVVVIDVVSILTISTLVIAMAITQRPVGDQDLVDEMLLMISSRVRGLSWRFARGHDASRMGSRRDARATNQSREHEKMSPEPVVIGYEMALKSLQAAVEDRGPDFTYKPVLDSVVPERDVDAVSICVYFDQDAQPSCLVGYALDLLGVGPFRFESGENRSPVSMLEQSGAVLFDTKDKLQTAVLLHEAQISQDTGMPWGACVQRAVERAGFTEPLPLGYFISGNAEAANSFKPVGETVL